MKHILLPLLLLLWLATAQASDCKQPLDDKTLDLLRLGVTDVQLQPGETHQFFLATFTSYAPPNQVPACATWKVEPGGKGVTIDADGLLKIDPKTPPGTKFVVTADIEQGRAQRRIPVVIYAAKAQPLVGLWKQQSSSGCSMPKEAPPPEMIKELEFRADGWFSVTWTPFETYRDYWGTYTAEDRKHTLSLKIDGGNYVPRDFRGVGKFKFADNNTVELSRLYLGSNRRSESAATAGSIPLSCRYLFIRIH
ncbi:MAG TPA: hypothetical protein VJA94_00165 [Candidatus Angelobacter sp.]